MTEARRRASQAYKERQEREGIKVVSLRLSKASRDNLKRWSGKQEMSQSAFVDMLLEQHET